MIRAGATALEQTYLRASQSIVERRLGRTTAGGPPASPWYYGAHVATATSGYVGLVVGDSTTPQARARDRGGVERQHDGDQAPTLRALLVNQESTFAQRAASC